MSMLHQFGAPVKSNDNHMTTTFSSQVYKLLKTVPKGNVTTYKALAHALGTRAYRAVGYAMRCNPYAPTVPCHRVVANDGTIGGFKGKTSGETIAEKIHMLKEEGVTITDNKIVNFPQILHTFS